MPWEMIENVRPTAAKAAPPANGIMLRCRSLSFTKKRAAKWIELRIGHSLAPKLMPCTADEYRIAIFFGSGDKSGKLAIAIDATQGGFIAKRRKDGSWSVSINEQSCDGLLALDFGPVALSAELLHERNEPPKAVITLPAEVVATD